MLYLLQINGVAPRALGPQGRSILGEISQIYPNHTKSILNQFHSVNEFTRIERRFLHVKLSFDYPQSYHQRDRNAVFAQ